MPGVRATALGLLVLVFGVGSAAAQTQPDWGQAGGGPAHTGYVTGATGISAANVGHLHVVWSHDFGGEPYRSDGVSSPSVVDGRVFVTVDSTSRVWAFRASDGTPLWHRQLASASGNLGSPAAGGDRVYVQGALKLWVLDARTGRTVWTRVDGGGGEPALAGGLVFVGGPDLTAYRAATGRLVWRRSGLGITNPPAVAGGVAFAASYDGESNQLRHAFALWAFDARTGRTLWERHPPLNGSEFPNGVVATPSVANGVVYDGGLDAYTTAGRLLWVTTRRGGGSDTTPTVGAGLVFNEAGAGDQNGGECAYRVNGGHQVWCVNSASVYDSSTLTNGVLFVNFGGFPFFTAYNARSGTRLFFDTNRRHVTTGQPVIADGTVYTGGDFGLFAYRS